MLYNVAQLLKGPSGGHREYDLDVEIANLDPEFEPLRPLTGHLDFMRTSQGILVRGRLSTVLRGTCRRCLEPCDIAAEVELEEEFIPAAPIGDEPLDTVPEEELDEALIIDGRHILDLTEVVRQELWILGPREAICSPDCAGLCDQCGGNLNLGECTCTEEPIDPRWAALQALLEDQVQAESE